MVSKCKNCKITWKRGMEAFEGDFCSEECMDIWNEEHKEEDEENGN
jgi:predicted nucleic acid-binding Zn ribbon protein